MLRVVLKSEVIKISAQTLSAASRVLGCPAAHILIGRKPEPTFTNGKER